MDSRAYELGRKIWDYMVMGQPLKKAEVIIVPGSLNTTPARRAAELFQAGYAPLIVMSGGLGRISKDHLSVSEAETFAAIAEELGVPRSQILIENKATNTGENIMFTRQLLERHGLHPKTAIIVQKPYAERRFYAAFKKRWPELDITVTSPQISYDEWAAEDKLGGRLLAFIVADLQRVIIYPEKGWQIPQEIPADVMEAYEELIKLGYTENLSKG